MKSRYEKILKSDKSIDLFFKTLFQDNWIYNKTVEVTAPILTLFVLNVLKKAVINEEKRLYFLARDGYPLLKIAEILIKKYDLDIECRYLFCSRLSLKSAYLYNDFENAIDEICIKSANTTCETILKTCGLTSNEIERFSKKLTVNDTKKLLNQTGISSISQKIKENQKLKQLILESSKEKYENTFNYLVQEGMLDNVKYAVVDSGWSGTMQRNLQSILRKNDFQMKGYYFGMYVDANTEKNIYDAYLFEKRKNFSRAYTFNNNVFECLCSANHAMTIGYAIENEKIVPVFKEYSQKFEVDVQIQAICDYAEQFVQKNSFENLKIDYSKLTYKITKKLMFNPTVEEVNIFGETEFCDDPTEYKKEVLASFLNKKEFKASMLIGRINHKLAKTKKEFAESFWIIGTAKKYYKQSFLLAKINVYLIQMIYFNIR